MIHPGFEALKKWEPIVYAAGFRARLAANSCPRERTPLLAMRLGRFRYGALELARHKRVLAEGREDDYADTWGLLFKAGGDARANGISFDESRAWPEGSYALHG